MKGQHILARALAVGITAVPSCEAIAQQNVPQLAGDGVKLEEIVVTAQKRESRLQDVPLTISAFTESTLKTLSISGSEDIGMVTPGLVMSRQLNTIQPFIRGIGAIDSAAGQESKTAIYVDGVYQSSLAAGLLSLNNIERIEVLKGPQGTLFGRNAVAGVVHIVTRDPSHTSRADASIGFGNYNALQANLYATHGLTDNLAADIAVAFDKQFDGWGTNLATGHDAYTSREFAARSKWKLDMGEGTDAILSIEINRARTQEGTALRKIPGSGPLITGFNVYPGFYNFNSVLDPNFSPGSPEPRGIKKEWATSLTVHHDMGWAKFVSISAYQNIKTLALSEISGLPFPFINYHQPTRAVTRSQEFQLLSPEGSRIKWIAGLYYFYNKASYRDGVILSGAAFGGGTNFFAKQSAQSATSYAAFGQATIPLGERTNVEAGLRYTTDKRHVRGFAYTQAGAGPIADQSERFNKLTYKLSVDHKFSDDVMIYALYSRGFKAGLYNTFVPSDPPVRPEVMDTYEAGLKTEWFDHRMRLNVSVFYNKIKDMQVSQVDAATGASAYKNAATAVSKGVEAELTIVPVDRLTITAAGTYLESKYLRFPGAQFTSPNPAGGNFAVAGDAAGNKLTAAPKWTPSVRATYEIPTSSGQFTLNALYSYNSGFYWAPDNRLREPSYSLVNASASWLSPSGMFGQSFWVRNLSGSKYHSYVLTSNTGDVGSPAAPRTFGGTLSVHF